MHTVKTKRGDILHNIPEKMARNMVKKHGATILSADVKEPFEIAPIPQPIKTVVVNDNEHLIKEIAELKAKNAKLASDIIALLKEIETLKEKEKENEVVPINKNPKKGTKAVDPNG